MSLYKRILLFFIVFVALSSFTMHKFYVSVYQINYAEKKKMLQITSRIFVDDLNSILKLKYHQKTNLGEPNESENDIFLLKKYLAENLQFKVNGNLKPFYFANKEMEGNVLICYLSIKEIAKIKTLEIQNAVLHDFSDEQQNIIQTNLYGKKESFLFTPGNAKTMLKP